MTADVVDLWEREWGGQMFCVPVSNHSLGQLILVKKNFPFQVKCVEKKDRLLSIEIELHDKTLYVANVYAPTVVNEKEILQR